MRGLLKLNLWLLFLWIKFAVLTEAAPSEPYLLYSSRTNIRSIDLNNLANSDVISGLETAIALGVDRVDKKIYYNEYSKGEIYRTDMNGTNEELVFSEVGKVEGIAIDWVARVIYWTAYTSKKIEVGTLDGKHRKILLNTGLDNPRGMAVDPEEGFLFWSDWGVVPAIERCTLAGGNRTVLVKDNITWPQGIAIDFTDKRLYWIDSYHDTITSIDYNGGQRTVNFQDKSYLALAERLGFDLDLYQDVLYWTDWSTNSIFSLRAGTILTNITIPTQRSTQGVMGIVVVDPSRQPTVTNRCGSNNGGCEQFCLLEPKGFKCECWRGFQLAEDGKSCKDALKDEFVMFADAEAGKIYQMQTDSFDITPIKFGRDANISRPVALEFDPVEDRVYWTDVTLQIICRVFRNGTGFQTLFSDNVGVADGLTIDLAGRNLYWTSTTHNTIEVSTLNGYFRRVLIDSKLDQPRDIIVDPVGGYMYWTDWGIPKIEQAYMDGTHRKKLVTRDIHWPNGLAIDHVSNRIYWADAFRNSIEFYDLESGQRDVLIKHSFHYYDYWFRMSYTEVNHPFGLTLLRDHLYWTNWGTKSVYRTIINTAANITFLVGGLNKPMDIHAYSIKPTQEYHKTYQFAFPTNGSKFSCKSYKYCPLIPSPPLCPTGYKSSREEAACGVSCRKRVGDIYRCECNNWKECAAKQTYAQGCPYYEYASYRVRECIQVVKPGRCPYNATQGSQKVCVNDEGCTGEEKCCKGNCTTPATIATHPCQINNGGCDELCLALPCGYRCGCRNNSEYNTTLKQCVKYDKLQQPPTIQKCIQEEVKEPYLLYSSRTNIRSIDLNNLAQRIVVSGLHNAIALGVDRVDEKIYYNEYSKGEIYRTDMYGTNEELVFSEVGKVEGIAIDWVARLIYWTAYTSKKIEVATLDGKHRKILLNTGLDNPRGMAVDPEEGFLFWSDWGVVPAIERCTLAGGNRTVLVKDNIKWPQGIAIDFTDKRLYWIDSYHDTITSIDYNGGQRTVIHEEKSYLALSERRGFDLDFFLGDLYWTDWSNNIYGLRQTKPRGIIFRNITIQSYISPKGIMGIVVVDPSRQPNVTNRCGSNNGGCEQFCMLEPKGFKCECWRGFQLAEDGKSCKDALKDEFIMFADAGAGKIYQMQTDSFDITPIKFGPDAKISRPVALEFDPVEDRVYWTDVTLQIICRVFRNGTGFQTLFSDNVGVADGLTIDLAGRNLYWTSTTHDTIEVSTLNGSFRRVLIDSKLDEPRDIIVDPVGGYMYWTDWGIPNIEQAYMDGTHRKKLVTIDIHWPNGLTIDHVYNRIYWADAFRNSIEFYDFESGQRDVLIEGAFEFYSYLFGIPYTQVNHPFGLTLLHNHLYWTNWRTKKSVCRTEKNSGANITFLVGGLSKPMDIHGYSIKPTQEYHKTYQFAFPTTGSDFSCSSSKLCPGIPSPPLCPTGYKSSREEAACGVSCKKGVGGIDRCECNNWKECAAKQTYAQGCPIFQYASYRVRECIQVVKPGRCPYNATQGSQNVCVNDEGCTGEEKCCIGKCTTPATIATHPCQINNGGCDELCLALPCGYRCGCRNNSEYNRTLKQCVKYDKLQPTHAPATQKCQSDICIFAGCNSFQTCVAEYNTTKCVCDITCTTNHEPVCGSDGKTYTNECFLKLARCKEDRNITISYQGECDVCASVRCNGLKTCVVEHYTAKCVCNMICTANYEPVCGSDRNTYSNECFLILARCKEDRNITVSYQGKCDVCRSVHCSRWKTCVAKHNTPECVCKITCTTNHEPVCGSDGKTYTNECLLKLARCKEDRNITISYQGECDVCRSVHCNGWKTCVAKHNKPECVCNITCTTENKQVCGSDEKTYTNECRLKLTRCKEDRNITISYQGECDVCRSVHCNGWKTCVAKHNKPECVCNITCTTENKQVCGSDEKTYTNECRLKLARCNEDKNITVSYQGKCDVCASVRCNGLKTCVEEYNTAKCVCDIACTAEHKPVCGSDGKTYTNVCHLKLARCNNEERNVNVIKQGECGCQELELDDQFNASSNLTCSLHNHNSINCKVECKSNKYKTAFPDFLNLRCEEGEKWVRGNNNEKYVPIIDPKNPPRCYETTTPILTQTTNSGCSKGSQLNDINACVPCPPGSFLDETTSKCKECDTTEYQDTASQTECKPCKTGTMTTTTKGAENCFYDHKGSSVIITIPESKLEGLPRTLANAFTNHCVKEFCAIGGQTLRRRKRARKGITFKPEDIIILSVKKSGNTIDEIVIVEFLLLDPTSSELIPNKAFDTKQLKNLLQTIAPELPFTLKIVEPEKEPPKESGVKSLAIGITVGLLVFIALVVGVSYYCTHKRRRKRRHQNNNTDAIENQAYEIPDNTENTGSRPSFVNRSYVEADGPPSYYASASIDGAPTTAQPPTNKPHVYETLDGIQARALSAKETPQRGAVVELFWPKQVELPDEKSVKSDFPVQSDRMRATYNIYSTPRDLPTESHHYEQPVDAEAGRRLEPPPKYEQGRWRENTASSMLPNAPKNKNQQDQGSRQSRPAKRSVVHTLDNPTGEQSES